MFKKKIKIGFILRETYHDGSINYFNNLISSIKNFDNIEVVIFSDTNSRLKFLRKGTKIVKSPIFNKKSIYYIFRKILSFIFKDYVLYYFLKKHKISILSHISFEDLLWKNCDIKSYTWIPDIQHKYFPKYFPYRQLYLRELRIRRQINNTNGIFVGSKSVLNEVKKFYGKKINGHVLYAYPNLKKLSLKINLKNKKKLIKKYKLPMNWYHYAGQFWEHKNHFFLLKALKKILERSDENINIVCTGQFNDPKNFKHKQKILKYIKKNNLSKNFKILGRIKYSDVIGIMCYSVSYLSPSLYEGWETGVTEATDLGKIKILSKIKSHIESKDKLTKFFNKNKKSLNSILISTNKKFNDDQEIKKVRANFIKLKKNDDRFDKQFIESLKII